MAEYFDKLLETRTLEVPLWKLRINQEEYDDLRTFLRNRFLDYGKFDSCPRECALYVAEWFKREIGDSDESGNDNKIFVSLGLETNKDGASSLISNAERVLNPKDPEFLGMESVKIRYPKQEHWAGKRRQCLLRNFEYYTLQYQGGFPFELAMSSKPNKWKHCIPRFSKTNLNLGDIPGSKIASRLLDEYKEKLVAAVRSNRIAMAPFADDEVGKKWFEFAKKGFKEGEGEREGRPFRIEWHMELSSMEVALRYEVHANANLKHKFLDYHPQATLGDKINIQVFEDERFVSSLPTYTRYEGKNGIEFITMGDGYLSLPYDGTSKISLRIAETGETILSSDIDMSFPHSFYQDGSSYIAGSKFNTRKSAIVFSKEWELTEQSGKAVVLSKTFNGIPYNVLICTPYGEDCKYFVFRNTRTGKNIPAGSEAPAPTWTEIEISDNNLSSLFLERVVDCSSNNAMTIYRCLSDDDKEVVDNKSQIQFSNDEGRTLNEVPQIGRFQCETVDKDGNASLPEKNIFNIGPGFSAKAVYFPDGKTDYTFSWAGGDVSIASGNAEKSDNGTWTCKKEDYPNYVKLHFIPLLGSGVPFDLHFISRYRELIIIKPNGKALKSGEIIALSDLTAYSYRSSDIPNVPINCEFGQLSTTINSNLIPENGPLSIPVNYLIDLDISGAFKPMLESGCLFDLRGTFFTIMDYPLSATYDAVTRSFSLSLCRDVEELPPPHQDGRPILEKEFSANLVLASMSNGDVIEITRSSDGKYYLPASLDGEYAVATTQRGYVKPFLFCTDGKEISLADHVKEKEILLSTPLNSGNWKIGAKFIDLGMRYSLNMSNLPWAGAIINDSLLLSLYIFQETAQNLNDLSVEERVSSKIKIARKFAKSKFYPDLMQMYQHLTILAHKENFNALCERFGYEEGIFGDGMDSFQEFCADTFTKVSSVIEQNFIQIDNN